MRRKVALVGIVHESNTFLQTPTSLNDFTKGHLIFGEEIREEYSEAFHELGGMLEILDDSDIEAVPLMFAEATPGGIVKSETLDYLYKKLETEVIDKGPFDGILIAAHGAAVSEMHPDMDGWWLQKLRHLVGDENPIIGTLDPHANISKRMVEATDALVAYKTNPHIDQRETGKTAAVLMVDILDGRIKPVQSYLQPEAIISIEQQYTKSSPCKELYLFAEQLGKHNKILSISIFLGFPYADVEEMGSGFIVITDNDKELAQSSAKQLRDYLWKERGSFVGKKITVEEAVSCVSTLPKPVLLLDMGDNVGGGAPGDSTFILDELEKSGLWKSFICIYDPESVDVASTHGLRNVFWLEIGAKTDDLHGKSVPTKVTLVKITDGVFREDQPRHGGQVNFNMGKIAIVETANGTTIMLTSLRIVPFSLNQLTTFGIEPEKYDVIVAKGVHAPVAAYESVCKSFVQVNTDGITTADIMKLSFKYRRKPLFPFEDKEHEQKTTLFS